MFTDVEPEVFYSECNVLVDETAPRSSRGACRPAEEDSKQLLLHVLLCSSTEQSVEHIF